MTLRSTSASAGVPQSRLSCTLLRVDPKVRAPAWPSTRPSARYGRSCHLDRRLPDLRPLLNLRGPSFGDFVPALEQFLGQAAGLPPAGATRPTQQWQAANFRKLH
ncbi:hypothetical protein KN815_00325 [Streptomyces sp. 4503]|uniref:Uncharacterized protein n=1 Tax=Streptomyces niphimycinicus TaxID=2842201 RepID=A0ABS6C6T9_9ACTN|nr:hypothetical protein [Streptomyces niphimycinicus]